VRKRARGSVSGVEEERSRGRRRLAAVSRRATVARRRVRRKRSRKEWRNILRGEA
jgi:hypothetical protein